MIENLSGKNLSCEEESNLGKGQGIRLAERLKGDFISNTKYNFIK